jgi:hypothetical protein
MITRRGLITGLGAGAVATFIPKLSWANREAGPLAMPPLLDTTGTGRFRLAAQSGLSVVRDFGPVGSLS